eukprot:3535255-Rhodomonas_salina.1
MDTRVSIQCYLMHRAGWGDPVEAQSNNLSQHQTEGVQQLMLETSMAHDTSTAMHKPSTHDTSMVMHNDALHMDVLDDALRRLTMLDSVTLDNNDNRVGSYETTRI